MSISQRQLEPQEFPTNSTLSGRPESETDTASVESEKAEGICWHSVHKEKPEPGGQIIWEYFVQGVGWREPLETLEILQLAGRYGFELVQIDSNGLAYFKRQTDGGLPTVDDLFAKCVAITDLQMNKRRGVGSRPRT